MGDPTKTYGWGVYEGPILDVANQFKPGMINAKGTDLDDVLKIIDSGNPVQVWVSMNVKAAYYTTSWKDIKTGLTVKWPRDFHSLVITGYDNENIYVSDPDSGTLKRFIISLERGRYTMKTKLFAVILVLLIIAGIIGIVITNNVSNEFEEKMNTLKSEITQLDKNKKTYIELIGKKDEFITKTRDEIINTKKGSNLTSLSQEKQDLINEIKSVI